MSVWSLLGRQLRRRAVARSVRKDFRRYAAMAGHAERAWRMEWSEAEPRRDDGSQDFDRHYVLHTAWAARQLRELAPREHVDIGSSLFFVALLSAFMPVRFYDFRPPDLALDGLECAHADLSALPFADGGIASLSCMHVIEHVGLGRYGDPLDPLGDLRAARELERVLAPGGTLLVVVPVGRSRIVFNAHRVYACEQLRGLFPGLELEGFALIPDGSRQGGGIEDASFAQADRQEYGCGCFRFSKPGPEAATQERA